MTGRVYPLALAILRRWPFPVFAIFCVELPGQIPFHIWKLPGLRHP